MAGITTKPVLVLELIHSKNSQARVMAEKSPKKCLTRIDFEVFMLLLFFLIFIMTDNFIKLLV